MRCCRPDELYAVGENDMLARLKVAVPSGGVVLECLAFCDRLGAAGRGTMLIILTDNRSMFSALIVLESCRLQAPRPKKLSEAFV